MFKKMDGVYIEDVNKYVLEWIDKTKNKYNDVEIHVGTDSQDKGRFASYVTVICMREVGKGVHIIGDYEKVVYPVNPENDKSKKMALFPRLWGEVEKTNNAAISLQKALFTKLIEKNISFTVHLDINPKESEGSHVAYRAGVGLLKGQGFEVTSKPDSWAASKAADMLCR